MGAATFPRESGAPYDARRSCRRFAGWKPNLDVHKVREAAQQEPRPNKEHHAERDFCDDQKGAYSLLTSSADGAFALRLDARLQIDSTCVPCAQKSEQQGGNAR